MSPITFCQPEQVQGEGFGRVVVPLSALEKGHRQHRNNYAKSKMKKHSKNDSAKKDASKNDRSKNHNPKNNYSKKPRKAEPPYIRKTIQLTPRFDRVTNIMAVDLEGCARGRVHYVGSLSFANEFDQAVYDTFANHGGSLNEKGKYVNFINKLPPEHIKKKLNIDWPDFWRRNGAQPIKDVMTNFIKLAEGRILVFHDPREDIKRLNNSAAYCGLTIPWDTIQIRNTQAFSGYWKYASGQPGPSLRVLADAFYPEMNLQAKGHTSMQDAIATMRLYKQEQAGIEREQAGPAPKVLVESVGESEEEALESETSMPEDPDTPPTEVSDDDEARTQDTGTGIQALAASMQATTMPYSGPAAVALGPPPLAASHPSIMTAASTYTGVGWAPNNNLASFAQSNSALQPAPRAAVPASNKIAVPFTLGKKATPDSRLPSA